jgi:hypothetical protein
MQQLSDNLKLNHTTFEIADNGEVQTL